MSRCLSVVVVLAAIVAVSCAVAPVKPPRFPGRLYLTATSALQYGCVPPCDCATRQGDLDGRFDAQLSSSFDLAITNVQFASARAGMKWSGSGSGSIASDGGPIFWNFELTDNSGNTWNYNGTSRNTLPKVHLIVSGQRQCHDEIFTIDAQPGASASPSSADRY